MRDFVLLAWLTSEIPFNYFWHQLTVILLHNGPYKRVSQILELQKDSESFRLNSLRLVEWLTLSNLVLNLRSLIPVTKPVCTGFSQCKADKRSINIFFWVFDLNGGYESEKMFLESLHFEIEFLFKVFEKTKKIC